MLLAQFANMVVEFIVFGHSPMYTLVEMCIDCTTTFTSDYASVDPFFLNGLDPRDNELFSILRAGTAPSSAMTDAFMRLEDTLLIPVRHKPMVLPNESFTHSPAADNCAEAMPPLRMVQSEFLVLPNRVVKMFLRVVQLATLTPA